MSIKPKEIHLKTNKYRSTTYDAPFCILLQNIFTNIRIEFNTKVMLWYEL